jgi:hypothetical protein
MITIDLSDEHDAPPEKPSRPRNRLPAMMRRIQRIFGLPRTPQRGKMAIYRLIVRLLKGEIVRSDRSRIS